MKNNEIMNPPIETTKFTDVAFAKESEKRHKLIKAEFSKIESSYEKIAFNLYWFYENKAFEQLGYKTFVDFTSKEYGVKKATAYNYVNIVERFGERDEQGLITGNIRKEFKDFKSSKLIALLDVVDVEQLKEFDAYMSVRDIKKKVKEINGEDTDVSDTSDNNNDDILDTTITEINRTVIIDFSNIGEYNDYLDKMNDLIEKNLKSKVFKDGKHKIEISVVW